MNLDSGETPLVLLCPAWKRWGTATKLKSNSVILHSRADETIPFSESEELVRNSGLPESTLIEVGTDHRLAELEPLKAMLNAVDSYLPALCIGIDVTWWGGSPMRRDSQRDTMVYSVLEYGTAAAIKFSIVDLSVAPNSRCHATEPNFDADGDLLAHRVAEIMSQYRGRFRKCIVALDAPLEARTREGQPKRVKAAAAGAVTGSQRRQCETVIQQHKSAGRCDRVRLWNTDLRIQAGSPVPARISSLIEKLNNNCGLACWGRRRTESCGQIIEVFPSEAIWSLGQMGGYGHLSSGVVRSYKSKAPRSLSREAAKQAAMNPLLGFAKCLNGQAALQLHQWSEMIAEHACKIAQDKKDSDIIRKGKGFDDPIESGIAFLTGIAFLGGVYHAWGDGSDGTIVGPGLF